MGQLQEIETIILDGDLDALHQAIGKLEASTDFDALYDAAGLLSEYGFIQEADRLYEMLRVHLPDEAQLKIDRAGTLLELGEEDEALLLLSEVKPDDDEYVQALLALADFYQMTGMAEAALSKIKEAHSLVPHEPIIRFAYAELLLDAGKFGEAARLYLELLKETDEVGGVSIASRLAEAYSAGAAYEEAIPYYEELLDSQRTPDNLFGAAFAYYQTRQSEQSIRLLTELIDMDPDYFSAYMLIGQAYVLTGDDRKAYEWFQEGIKRDPYDKELRLAAGKSAVKLGLPDEAEQHLEEALALDPEYIEPLITLASLYNEREKDEELLDLLADSKEVAGDIPLLNSFMAYASERMEQFEEAYVFYSKAYNGMREDFGFLESYANFLLEEGKRKEAIAIVRELVELVPDENWRTFLEAQNDEEV
ncbi:tetratricopeptide repeat protein [Sporosarcina sp. 179-K 3D1 HS]|uniref:tetratricopeptide repeat protein n=1 Tax=Sporosarcina sp. 179-K 3D1 HS TaxID=3232169 RepID=UPI0039A0BF30